jgi:hypothetical protein
LYIVARESARARAPKEDAAAAAAAVAAAAAAKKQTQTHEIVCGNRLYVIALLGGGWVVSDLVDRFGKLGGEKVFFCWEHRAGEGDNTYGGWGSSTPV